MIKYTIHKNFQNYLLNKNGNALSLPFLKNILKK